MLSYITLPIRILLSALFLTHTSPSISINQPSPVIEQVSLATPRIESQLDDELRTIYEVSLRDNATEKELGRIIFSYDKTNKSGYIARLHIRREERKHSYGSMLLKFALEKLSSLNCIGIYWQAYPFDLNPNQTPENMLPKLIAFYQRHGAQVISQNAISAEMVYYPTNAPQIEIA